MFGQGGIFRSASAFLLFAFHRVQYEAEVRRAMADAPA